MSKAKEEGEEGSVLSLSRARTMQSKPIVMTRSVQIITIYVRSQSEGENANHRGREVMTSHPSPTEQRSHDGLSSR